MSGAALRACPTCGGPPRKDLGLRNYSWIDPYLPGAEAGTDGDFLLEKGGHVLMLETKPGRRTVALGKRIALGALVRMGVNVLLVQELDERDEVGHPVRVTVAELRGGGSVKPMEEMPLDDLRRLILEWRTESEKNPVEKRES